MKVPNIKIQAKFAMFSGFRRDVKEICLSSGLLHGVVW
jgi:hypothetical protein